MSGVSPVVPTTLPIMPPQQTSECINCVSGFTLAITTFILGSILMLIMIAYIFMIIFGQPMAIAKKVATSGGSLIQHFNTSKSCSFKDALVSGGAFRYHNIRDGTVAATANSVNNIRGRNLVLTFAQLGVTIPVHLLGGISVLVHEGVKNIADLRRKLTYTKIYTEERLNEEGEIEKVETGREQLLKNETVVTGYNFEDFDTLLKQSKEEKLIPLVVEAVPDFVERAVSADYTEKKIKIRQMMMTKDEPTNDSLKIMTIAIACIAILIIGMVVK